DRELGPMPYIISVVMLLVAATAEARWLSVSFVACLIALGIEGRLTPWTTANRDAVVTGPLFAALVYVVSLLHVRCTERAFAIAEKQDRARALAAAAAVDSERRYRLIADSADDLIALADGDGRAVYLSPSHGRVLGLDVERALGHTVADLLDVDNPDEAG